MKTLILLPGAMGAAAQFESILPLLQSDFNVVPMDLPGHGLNPYASNAITVPQMADAFIAQLKQMGVQEPVAIFGHSLGGYLGLYLIKYYPGVVGKLFTLGTKWHWTPETAAKETAMLNPDKMMEKIPGFVNALKAKHTQDWKVLVNNIADLMLDLGHFQYLDLTKLSDIETSVRIGLGDRDAMVSLDETIAQYRALKNAELQVYPNTPHPYEKVNISTLAQDIKAYFSKE